MTTPEQSPASTPTAPARAKSLARVAALTARGYGVSLEDRLGPALDEETVSRGVGERIGWLEEWGRRGEARCPEIVVRPSALGAGLGWSGEQRAMEHVDALTRAARRVGGTITLDLDDAHGPGVDVSVEMALELRRANPTLGVSIPAAWRRAEALCEGMAHEDSRVRLRRRSSGGPEPVHAGDHEVDLAYVRCLKVLMEGEGDPRVATHDPRLIAIAGALAARHGREPGSHEYEFARRARRSLRTRLFESGERVRLRLVLG